MGISNSIWTNVLLPHQGIHLSGLSMILSQTDVHASMRNLVDEAKTSLQHTGPLIFPKRNNTILLKNSLGHANLICIYLNAIPMFVHCVVVFLYTNQRQMPFTTMYTTEDKMTGTGMHNKTCRLSKLAIVLLNVHNAVFSSIANTNSLSYVIIITREKSYFICTLFVLG